MYKKNTAKERVCTLTNLCKPLLMRLFPFILIICMHLSASALGQKVTISRNNVPLKKAIKEIKRQSGYTFLYDASVFFNMPDVSVNVADADVAEVLDQCFDGLPLHYVVRDNYVVISRRVLPIANPLAIQQQVGEGRVTSNAGEILEGVTVSVRQSQAVTSTNADGRFRITVPATNSTLVFSLLGFETREIVIGSQTSLDVTMTPTVSDLDEVVVVGFGERRRADLTGSISTVGAADIGRIPQASPQFALQGHTTGVRVAPVSGN